MYTTFFNNSDIVIKHMQSLSTSIPINLQPTYAGFVCIIAVATYEMAIRNILVDFCTNQNKLFGDFFNSKFPKLNGNIDLERINSQFLSHFGKKYRSNFDDLVNFEDKYLLQKEGKKLKDSYKNIITYRHAFAHTATFTYNATLTEVCTFYFTGKRIIECLDVALSI